MRFWDSSALVPLLVEESRTARVRSWAQADPIVVTWWASEVECASAIARLEREQQLTPAAATAGLARLRELHDTWHEIEPTASVRETAKRLLRVHPLRAADALQLAAAVVASAHRPASLEFASLDDRLIACAEREGFPTLR